MVEPVRRYVGILILAAFLCRAAIPFGFMLAPSSAAPGVVEIVICTDHGAMTVALDEDGDTSEHARISHDPCPFAASALPAVAGQSAALSLVVTYASVIYKLAETQFSLTPRPRTTFARGPPIVV
ncbi:DUF2946 family protein [Hyphomicrobium sp.]|uniref:DUF2946 family protein n=1 Tax=Hyphomicrobium sp. TaxID=82 RepID=UPI002FE3AF3E